MRVFQWALLLLVFIVGSALAQGDEEGQSNSAVFATLFMGILAAAFQDDIGFDTEEVEKRKQAAHRNRTRKYVNQIFDELGPYYVRRAYRMDASTFWCLHRTLKPYFPPPPPLRGKKKRAGAKSGRITTPVRLSAALRYFAGGRPEDICLVHGISHTEVFRSVWFIVDAVNRCKDDIISIQYPESHEKQKEVAAGFVRRSKPKFDCCAGCIDGMLVWTEKPTEEACKLAGCGPKKFLCGRKKNFGLNMQGTCDSDRKFLDVQLRHPASVSDFLSFSTSKLYRKMEQPGFLAEGLCLFGDSAYVNCRYFATPFKACTTGSRDDYNYYHSQVRIKIECAFGMLVKRWGILRRPISATIGLRKTTALVICLCRLHNFCIEKNLEKKRQYQGTRTTADLDVPRPLAADNVEIIGNGGIGITSQGQNGAAFNAETPEELLHHGEHFNDTTAAQRRQFICRGMEACKVPP